MIEFSYLTVRAELNAMPCWPDEFMVVIPERDVIVGGNDLLHEFNRFAESTKQAGEYMVDGPRTSKKDFRLEVQFMRRKDIRVSSSRTVQDVLVEKIRRAYQ